jgi:hypothetical protein
VSDVLAADLAHVLAAEPCGLPCCELVRRLQRRRGDVLAVLRTDARFKRRGRTRGSRWQLAASEGQGRNGTGLGRNVLPWLELDPSGVPLARREPKKP